MKLFVIVSMLKGAYETPGLLERLFPLVRIGTEVIIADGGSNDGLHLKASGS